MSIVNPYSSSGAGYVAQKARSEAERNRRRGKKGGGAEAAAAEEDVNEIAQEEETAESEKAEESAAGEAVRESGADDDGSSGEVSSNPDDWEVIAEAGPKDETEETEDTEETKETEKTEEQKKEESARLAAFKQGFLKKINAVVGQPQFAATKIELKISDEGYQRMLDDPAYEQKVLEMFRRDLGTSLSFVPSSAVLTVDGKTENVAVDYSGRKSGYDRSRALLGTMSKPYMRGGLDMLQSQVLSVLQSRLGSSSTDLSGLSSLATQRYAKSGLFGGSTIDAEG